MLIVLLTVSDVLSVDINLGMGLSAKNLLVNVVAFALVWRIVHEGKFRVEAPMIVTSFALMFFYALLTMVLAIWVIQYPHYDTKGSIVTLKTEILDPALFFLTFFYATRTEADVKAILRALLVCIGVASALTITNVYGITDVGHMPHGDNGNIEGGRIYGFFGHANETGVFMVVLLPAYIAATVTSRGLWRLILGCGLLLCLVIFVMTGSRGAILGLTVGGIWGAILCRKYLPPAKLFRGAAVIIGLAIPAIAVLGAQYGQLFMQRLMSQSTSSDMTDVSSGRTIIWANAIGRMMETPLSLITGFGWNVYDSMGFSLIPHNHYIALWFELGLLGVICFLVIIYSMVKALLAAMKTADHNTQLQLIACVYGCVILLVGITVEQLSKPWLYIWPYLGISLRAALLSLSQNRISGAVTADRVGDKRRKSTSHELTSPVTHQSHRSRG
jgi:O-antigen ligase